MTNRISAVALVFLLTTPAFADGDSGTSPALGSVRVIETAALISAGSAVTLSDTTALVFPGDRIETQADARAVVELNDARVLFGGGTTATIARERESYVLGVAQGSLELELGSSGRCDILTPAFVVRPSALRPASSGARVGLHLSVAPDGALLMRSLHGAIAIEDHAGNVVANVGSRETRRIAMPRSAQAPQVGAGASSSTTSTLSPLAARTIGAVGMAGVVGGFGAVANHNTDDSDDGSPR